MTSRCFLSHSDNEERIRRHAELPVPAIINVIDTDSSINVVRCPRVADSLVSNVAQTGREPGVSELWQDVQLLQEHDPTQAQVRGQLPLEVFLLR